LCCQGFINNASQKQPKGASLSRQRNFANLKTQCYFELQRQIKNISISDESIKDKLSSELDVIVQTHLDKDAKITIISKDEMKEKLGRSPDYADALMMRMYYELDRREEVIDEIEIDNGDPLGIFTEDIETSDIELSPY
jgi:hypothetical protein